MFAVVRLAGKIEPAKRPPATLAFDKYSDTLALLYVPAKLTVVPLAYL